ncbi:hypothetical protein [Roseicitreum antarcticum]|uniref:Uncharacterized protein n=1 Tax=Roseicitreum antarcticum TaxID=564137 RepID=A0A1H3EXN1_9RHOB|nr:hypothetical protein [Roseicitreum antarcticum]SDX82838.1 hypothetical protein SAMN04488238_12713 [Roseicitreum antarcticum]
MNLQQIIERVQGMEGRLIEDEIYRIVWEEIENGQFDTASKARAMAKCANDGAELRSAYIRHRVRRLKDEIAIANATRERTEREAAASAQQENRPSKEGVDKPAAPAFSVGAFIGSSLAAIFLAITATGLFVTLMVWFDSYVDISDSSPARVFTAISLLLIWFVLLPFVWIKLFNYQGDTDQIEDRG